MPLRYCLHEPCLYFIVNKSSSMANHIMTTSADTHVTMQPPRPPLRSCKSRFFAPTREFFIQSQSLLWIRFLNPSTRLRNRRPNEERASSNNGDSTSGDISAESWCKREPFSFLFSSLSLSCFVLCGRRSNCTPTRHFFQIRTGSAIIQHAFGTTLFWNH